jgi:hypothetical protein
MKRSLRLVGLLGVATVASMLGATSAGSGVHVRWIVFAASPENGTQPTQLFRIRADGSGLEQLTSRRPASAPSFSPDGEQIAYARFNAGISVVTLDGRGRHRLTGGSSDAFPVWSPNGKRIAFLRPGPATREYRLYVMDADGHHQRLLERAPWPAGRPSWTPDSRALVVARRDARAEQLYRVDATSGRVLRRYALRLDHVYADPVPTVAADGRSVAFVGSRPVPTGCRGRSCELTGLYDARLSGGKARLLEGARPAPAGWSPDGRTLALADGYQLQLWPLGGGAAVFVSTGTNAVAGEAPPAWQPG